MSAGGLRVYSVRAARRAISNIGFCWPRRTAGWTGQQMVEAFPEDTAPRYLLRDRDKIYRSDFRERIRGMSLEEVLSAPASPWQRAYVERLIGSVRRDCLDHVIVLGEEHLRRILKSYLTYLLSPKQDSLGAGQRHA